MGIGIFTHTPECWEDEAIGDDAGTHLAAFFEEVFKRLHPPWEKVDEDDVSLTEIGTPEVLPADRYPFPIR